MNAGIINIYTKPTDCPIALNNSKPFPVSKKDLYPINANENTIFIYFEDVRLLSAIGQSVGFVYMFIIPAFIVVFLANKLKINFDEFMSAWLFTQICCLFVITSH
jgi:hypothetical protein